MTKTKEELQQLKTEYEKLNSKLNDLSEDELKEVTGGFFSTILRGPGHLIHSPLLGESEEIKPKTTEGWFGTPDPITSGGGQHQR